MLVLKLTTRLALEDNITLQSISELDHYYAFDIKSGDHYQLNHSAHWVLVTIGSGTGFQDLLNKFAKAYDLQQNTAQEDLSEIIQNAFENRIIKEVIV